MVSQKAVSLQRLQVTSAHIKFQQEKHWFCDEHCAASWYSYRKKTFASYMFAMQPQLIPWCVMRGVAKWTLWLSIIMSATLTGSRATCINSTRGGWFESFLAVYIRLMVIYCNTMDIYFPNISSYNCEPLWNKPHGRWLRGRWTKLEDRIGRPPLLGCTFIDRLYTVRLIVLCNMSQYANW